MNHDVGHLHTDKGLLPVPTTNRDITKSQIHTSQDRAEGTCAHKVPPAKAPAICVRRYKSREVGVNYVKVVRAFCSGRIKEKNFWYLIMFREKFKIHSWALGRKHYQLECKRHNSDQIRIEQRGIVSLHKLQTNIFMYPHIARFAAVKMLMGT